MVEWNGELVEAMKAYIHVTSFDPIIHLLLEWSASAFLAQCLAKRWWDTTHTFHIAEREMIVTPWDFHHMTSLRCDGNTINLEGESGIMLAINLLGRSYSSNMIRYFDIKADYQPFP